MNSDTVTGATLASTTGAPVTATVGDYNIVASAATGTGLGNYTITYHNGTLTVNPAALTVTANGQTITYGASVPTTTVSYSGFVNGDTSASLTTAPTLASSQNGTPNAGTYTGNYTASSAVDSNYTISYVAGNLVVNPHALTITAADASKNYGSALNFSGTEFSASGLVNGDTATGVTLTSAGAGASASVAGSAYNIVPSAAAGTGLSNYTITYTNGHLTVNPVALTITANGQTIAYGVTVPAGTVSYSGFVNGDTAASLTTVPTLASAQSGHPNAGTYTGNYTASGAVNGNYTISYVAGNLVVNPTALTITASSQTIIYGASVPTTTVSYSGFVNGDTAASLTTAPTIASTQSGNPNAGIYTGNYTASGAANSNYTISYTAGNLVVNPAALTVMADSQTITYGATVPAATASYSGFVNGDTSASLTTQPTLSSALSGIQNAGTYNGNYTASGAVDSNYTISYVAGNLLINPATLVLMTVTANDASKIFGNTYIFAGTEFTSSGLLSGDTIGSVTLTSSGAVSTAPVGSYAIAASAATGGTFNAVNYTISYVDGTLVVNAAPVPPVTSIPNSVLLVAQNIPVYTPPVINLISGNMADSIVTTSSAPQQPAAQSQSSSQGGNSDEPAHTSSGGGRQQNSLAGVVSANSNGSVNLMGGLLQLDPKTIKEFGLKYLLK